MLIKPSAKSLSDFLSSIEESEFSFLLKRYSSKGRTAMHLDGEGPRYAFTQGPGYTGRYWRSSLRVTSDLVPVTYAAETFMETIGEPWRKSDTIYWDGEGAKLSYQFLPCQQPSRTDRVKRMLHVIDVLILPEPKGDVEVVRHELGDYADRLLYTPLPHHSWKETALRPESNI